MTKEDKKETEKKLVKRYGQAWFDGLVRYIRKEVRGEVRANYPLHYPQYLDE